MYKPLFFTTCERCIAEAHRSFGGKITGGLQEEHTCERLINTPIIPAYNKKNQLLDRADRYTTDIVVSLNHPQESITTRDAHEAITAAQRLIETLSVWIALDKGEVE